MVFALFYVYSLNLDCKSWKNNLQYHGIGRYMLTVWVIITFIDIIHRYKI
jgi:hypothetical protein